MTEPTVTYTTRLPKRIYDKMLAVVAATDSEVSRAELIRIGLEHLFAQLSVCPSMIPGYDPAKDKSARQKRQGQCVAGKGNVKGKNE